MLLGTSACVDGRPGNLPATASKGRQGPGRLRFATLPARDRAAGTDLCLQRRDQEQRPGTEPGRIPSRAGGKIGWCTEPSGSASRVRFSFAVISDTHSYLACRPEQGPRLPDAVALINSLRPAFVIGLGDLIAGGGDCAWWTERHKSPAQDQLLELRRVLLDELDAPFVPVSGNHDLTPTNSRDRAAPRVAWTRFWRAHRRHLLPALRGADASESWRFTYKGVGFALISSYGTVGLKRREMRWIRANVRPGDLVFRHVNPFGMSCASGADCGCAVGHQKLRHP